MLDSPTLEHEQVRFNAPRDVPQREGSSERMSFSGTGSEYFGIWIVNILLSIVTLGIYSAWAKVRRTRYFYDNTRLAGSSFEYHGNPISILKGRIIAVALIFGYQLALQFNLILGLVIFAAVGAVFPWLMWKSMQFKLYNSSYRGIRFGFRGALGKAYKAYLLMPFIASITFGLGAPFAHQRIKQFQHDESRFGNTHFSFHATVGGFYIVYLIGFGVMMAGTVAITLLFGGTIAAMGIAGGGLKEAGSGIVMSVILMVVAMYAWMFAVVPLVLTLTQNLIWNNTRLGDYRFTSDLQWTRTTFIAFTNLLGILVTFGLYTPFAKIRSLKNRIEAVSLVQDGSLDEFVADEQQNASAVGEGVADLLDFDISL